MGINNALYMGSNSLIAYGESVQVIGNNISNVNTLGFKGENVKFGDVLSSNAARLQIGNGVQSVSVLQDQAKGSFQRSNNSTDMAIDGNGLFVLKNPTTGLSEYTRVGDFALDKTQQLVAGNGSNVQGWQLDSLGNPIGSVVNVNVGGVISVAQASSLLDVGVNLDNSVTAIDPAVTPFDPANAATYHFKSDVQVLDSLGVLKDISVYYTKVGLDAGGNSVWDYHAMTDGANVGGVAGVMTEIQNLGLPSAPAAIAANPTASTVAAGVVTTLGTQSLVFNNLGQLDTEIAPSLTIPWAGGAAVGTIQPNFGAAVTVDSSTGTAAVPNGVTGSGTDGAILASSGFATRFSNRDGFPSGQLDRMEVDSKGKMFGIFTNGQRRPLYQVALASFPDESKLTKNGASVMTESTTSGAAVIDKPGNSGLGVISSFSLETSNVDLAGEFVNMIVVQRGYEANSKVVQTTDAMLQTLLGIKR
ncbi:MAG: flagellar hook-basal body complex protein [Zetaproteobacteria bacterium]|nr:flagellar hook-basal body complex protein [Zetaproteobacteria bacterium]